MASLLAELRAALGDDHCLTPAPAGADWLGRTRVRADALVRPDTTDATAAVLAACGHAGAAVVPVGGDTGLVGGTLPAVPDRPVVLLSTSRLTGVAVDRDAGTLLAGAGETLAAVQQAAAGAGWRYGVDLAARDSASIGGTVATNAGGIHVCAYGSTRAQLLGVEAVLADGSIITDLRGLPKDNSGLDLRDLLCGSEGILAVVTKILVRLHRPPARLTSVLAATPTMAAALALARSLATVGRWHAVEVVDARSWHAAAADLGLRDPLPPGDQGYAVLIELTEAGTEEELGEVLENVPVVIATDAPARRQLWAVREAQSEWWSLRRSTTETQLRKYDVALPASRLDAFVAAMSGLLGGRQDADESPGWGVFGHLAEGSLHVQSLVPGGPAADGAGHDGAGTDDAVWRLAAKWGGTISAEHGIGRDKVQLLSLCRGPAEIAAARAIKQALDPTGMLNPGAVLPS